MMKFLRKVQDMSHRGQVLLGLTVLAVAVLLAYSNSFTADWHYDDFHHIKENINIRRIDNIPMFFRDASTFSRNPQTAMYRPLLMASHAVNYQMGLLSSRDGYDVTWYHVTNFLLHMVTSVTMFFIALFIFARRVVIPGVNPVLAATFAGLLFGLHTINTETVIYVSSRSAGMSTMFAFGAFYFYLKASDGPTRAAPLFLSAFLYSLGLLSKEIAITLPAMLVFYEILLNRGGEGGATALSFLGRVAARIAPHSVVAALYLLVRHLVLKENLVAHMTSRGGTQAASNLTSQLATQTRVWIYYIREWLWPTSLSIDKPFRVSMRFSEFQVLLALAVIVAILALVLVYRRRFPLVTFGTLCFFVALLPESVFRLNVIMNDHRLYLSGLGATLVFTYVSGKLHSHYQRVGGRHRTVFTAIALATLVLMGLGTFKRNMAFATEETMWQDVILKDSRSVRGYNNLGIYYEQNGELDRSVKYYNKTIQLAPMFPNPYINLGNVFHKKKDYEKASHYMSRAIQLDPTSALAYYNHGNILREWAKEDQAIESYKQALKFNPRYIEAANNLANIYFKRMEYEKAVEYYSKALEIDPTFAMSFYNIGLAYENLNKIDQAVDAFRKFLRFWNGDPQFTKLANQRISRYGNKQ